MARLKLNITHRNQTAFTLIEVLVALTIIAITLGAIIKTSSNQAANTTYLKQKTIGSWVALNMHNQLLLEKTWPSLGKSTDSISMANHEWHWQREIQKTLSPETRKIIYRIYVDEDRQQQVSKLIGYITNPEFLESGS